MVHDQKWQKWRNKWKRWKREIYLSKYSRVWVLFLEETSLVCVRWATWPVQSLLIDDHWSNSDDNNYNQTSVVSGRTIRWLNRLRSSANFSPGLFKFTITITTLWKSSGPRVDECGVQEDPITINVFINRWIQFKSKSSLWKLINRVVIVLNNLLEEVE